MTRYKNFKFLNIVFPLFLIFIGLFLAFKNYTPDTYLLGWDSIHSEFNFHLAFKRAFFGVWRADQGVGTLAVHSHMADLPRIIFLWLSSFVLPTNLLRYSYIFLCLILGSLGVYYFLKYVFQREKDGLIVNLASVLGALFYLLNLGTLQHFFVPFEMFNVQFAFLPWLFLFVLKYFREGKKKNLIAFVIFSLLATPMAYAATLFYAYFGASILFLFVLIILGKQKKVAIKRSLTIIFLLLTTNAFWLLPNIHSIFSQSNVVSMAKINRLFSPEAMLRNKEYGQVSDVLINKNFLFEWRVFDGGSNTFVDLMEVWNKHLANIWALRIGYVFSGLSILGIILNLIKKNRIGIGLLAITLYSLFFIFNTNYVGGGFYRYFYEHFDIFREGLRMPFTKFSILFIFPFSYFLGYFLLNLFSVLNRKIVPKILLFGISITVFSGLIYFCLPMFRGYLISSVVKTKPPDEYFQVFHWFNGKDGRIAKLPLNSMWGWEYHNWGYEGSGFIPFGIESPILDRDFDRWSASNESFYTESAFSLYTNDNEVFQKVLEKYQVKYLLLDESIINAGGSEKLLFISQIKDLLSKSENIKEVARFNFLTIFEVIGTSLVSEIWAPVKFVKVNVDLQYSEIDPIYLEYGDYIKDSKAVSFPFVNFDKRMGIVISADNENIILKNNEVEATFPIKEKVSEDFRQNRGFPQAYNCDLLKKGRVEKQNLGDKIIYKAFDSGVSCDFFDYPELKYSQGYVLRIKGENIEGRSLKIYLQNIETGRMDLEELLPTGMFDEYFVILPKVSLNSGYSLNLETRSFGRITSENMIETIEFVPINTELLTKVKTNIGEPETVSNNLEIVSVKKSGNWYFSVETIGNGLLNFGQGFDKGWIAFGNKISKGTILEHTKINSWANGWLIPNGTNQVNIIFWPQLLEWGGMILGGLSLLGLLLVRSRTVSKTV